MSAARKKSSTPERRLAVTPLDLLLPYQRAWVQDAARFKIWLKSRQIGGSLAASFEVVADAIETGGDWVILSAGERQALEFMDKVNRAALGSAHVSKAKGLHVRRPAAGEARESLTRFAQCRMQGRAIIPSCNSHQNRRRRGILCGGFIS